MEKPCTTCPYAEKLYMRKPRPDRHIHTLHDVYCGLICKKYQNKYGFHGLYCQEYKNWQIIQKAEKLTRDKKFNMRNGIVIDGVKYRVIQQNSCGLVAPDPCKLCDLKKRCDTLQMNPCQLYEKRWKLAHFKKVREVKNDGI